MPIIALSTHDAIVWVAFTVSLLTAFLIVLVGDDSPWLTLLLWALVIGCAVVAGLG
jgi:hypothetical protein